MQPCIIPEGNPIQFVPEDILLPSQSNQPTTYGAWYQDQRRFWQIEAPYMQPIQQTDRSMFQAKFATVNDCLIFVLDVKGAIITSFSSSSSTSLPGDLYPNPNFPFTPLQLYTYQFSIKWSALSLPYGIYVLRMMPLYDPITLDNNPTFLSEPLNYQEHHPTTRLIGCNDDKNVADMNFEQLYPNLSMRVEADLVSLSPASADVVMQDQNYQLKKLYSQSYNLYKLQVGLFQGVPNYVLRKINWFLSRKYITIDNQEAFIKEDGSKFEGNTVETTGLGSRSIMLREYNFSAKSDLTSFENALIYTKPGTYPYALDAWTLSDGLRSIPIPLWIFDSVADETAYKNYLNNTIAPSWDLNGVFDYSGLDLLYQNANNEFFASSGAPIYLNNMDTTLHIATAGVSFSFSYVGGRGIVDFGDGNKTDFLYSGSGSASISHTYATTGNKTHRIFTDDIMTDLKYNGGSANAYLTQILTGSKVSANLTGFLEIYNDFGSHANIDPSFLDNARSKLQYVQFLSSNIKGFSPALLATSGYSKLIYVTVAANQLAVADVDAVFVNLNASVASTPYLSRYVSTQGQTPAAPPTVTSAAARAALTANGWTIYKD